MVAKLDDLVGEGPVGVSRLLHLYRYLDEDIDRVRKQRCLHRECLKVSLRVAESETVG